MAGSIATAATASVTSFNGASFNVTGLAMSVRIGSFSIGEMDWAFIAKSQFTTFAWRE